MTSLFALRKPPCTHFDVKLLITPVVVSYSLASANSDAIPTHAPMSITSRGRARHPNEMHTYRSRSQSPARWRRA